jgi:addiction module HigA family antidote
MTETTTRELAPMHPGEFLREVVLPSIMADATGLSLEQVQEILACRAPVTTDVADRIGNWIGNGPRLWLNLQARWDSR